MYMNKIKSNLSMQEHKTQQFAKFFIKNIKSKPSKNEAKSTSFDDLNILSTSSN